MRKSDTKRLGKIFSQAQRVRQQEREEEYRRVFRGTPKQKLLLSVKLAIADAQY
jgi:hypothetical protein